MIDRAEDLLPRLLPQGIEQHELVSVLTSRFGGSVHDTDRRVTLFPMHPPHALRLEYYPDLEPSGAFAEEVLTSKDIEIVRAELTRKYLDSAGSEIGQMILFASNPVEGFWGFCDRFQIIPTPPAAPRPHFLMAAHPFLLEFTYNRSHDSVVSRERRLREGYRIALVLSSLLRGGITWHSLKAVGNFDHAWVQLPDSGLNWNVAYCQIKYEHASISHVRDAFTPTGGMLPIPLVIAEKYYRHDYHCGGGGMELSDDLEESFHLYFALPSRQRDRFLQASYWLNHANRQDSFSAMFMHTIQAIESLAWQPRSQTNCPSCQKPTGPGPTRLFNEFLEEFAPGASEGRRLLYNVRSGLSHGSKPPFLVDMEIHFGNVPEGYEELGHVREALTAARMAMHNWLRKPYAGQSAPT